MQPFTEGECLSGESRRPGSKQEPLSPGASGVGFATAQFVTE
jgi:hypothetical protein